MSTGAKVASLKCLFLLADLGVREAAENIVSGSPYATGWRVGSYNT